MPISRAKVCPHCQETFSPRRKNQDYCSTECRTDANNQKAKTRYATFKKVVIEANVSQEKISKLKERVASLMVVVQGIEEVDSDTISYDGDTYRRQNRVGQIIHGIILREGGAVQTSVGNIIYRSKRAHASDNCWEYVRM